MNSEAEISQARIEAALDRIEAGVGRLREAARHAEGPAALRAERDALTRQVAELKAENARLTDQMGVASRERDRAKNAADKASYRLDGAIDQLKLVLEG